MKCEICDNKYKSLKGILSHISQTHKITGKEYYDKYMKKEGEDVCKYCPKNTPFLSCYKGYHDICNDLPCINKKIKATSLIKFNVEHASKSESIKQLKIKNCREKTGFDHYLQVPLLIEKRKKTWHKKSKKEKHKKTIKTKKTKKQKYGDENYNNMDKNKKTKKVKYGDENYNNIEKNRQTCLEKYGKEYYFETNEFREQCTKTLKDRYGNNYLNKLFRLRKYTTKFGDVVHYQSKPELKYIQYCEKNNIRILDGDVIDYEINCETRQYFVDFKILEHNTWRLIEVKDKHKWWYEDLENGTILAKTRAAQKYTKEHNYFPYKIKFSSEIDRLLLD